MADSLYKIAPEPSFAEEVALLAKMAIGITPTKVTNAMANRDNLIDLLPSELLNMLYKELFVSKFTIHRGAAAFGPLSNQEKTQISKAKFSVGWQFLLTSKRYHKEGLPFLYKSNHFALYTENNSPGPIGRFPFSSAAHMSFLKNVNISFRLDYPDKPGGQAVTKFIDGIIKHSELVNFHIMIASVAGHFDDTNPWNILMMDNPVIGALERLIKSGAAKNIAVRLHDGAYLGPTFGRYLFQELQRSGLYLKGHHLVLLRSCSCHTYNDSGRCIVCDGPQAVRDQEPILRVTDCNGAEADENEVMACQEKILSIERA